MTDNIIDVSHWENPINFRKVADAGIVAIIAKASQGATGQDSTYRKYKTAAVPYGFLWGSYHFGTGDDVAAQVKNYLQTAAPQNGELVCLDFEQNPQGSTMTLNQAREFVGLFQHETGR